MKPTISLLLILICINLNAQEDLSWFLPADVTYNSSIPTPEQFFYQKTGEWHLSHEQILSYAREIEKVSSRVVIREYARSFENRPLIHLIFTSAANQKNLEKLRELHLANLLDKDLKTDINKIPLVIELGYNVHGNESSAANSSVLTMYYLAAAEGSKIDQLLESSIILVDPCLNPDGLTRHSTWANMNQSYNGVTRTESRQIREMWPGGRTSHYWFDLNRDYLLLTHPESKGRVETYYHWLPNIVTDHHEMDANATFFFQPGVKTRNNPLTPELNLTITEKISKFHARYLDRIGVDYYSEEQYDDYYIGKGSSYPDINSGIGILFEQAGFRARIRETANGERKLAYGIRNQFTVTLSTLDAALSLKKELIGYQREFYENSLKAAGKDPVKYYIFGDENDNTKTLKFIELLRGHKIEIFRNAKNITLNGKTFNAGKSYVVPLKQKQYRMVKCLFEEVKTYADTVFYDVSTWTMPYAFGVPFEKITNLNEISFLPDLVEPQLIRGKLSRKGNAVAYLFKWNEYASPTALYGLQKSGLRTKVATEKFSCTIEDREVQFLPGTILIPCNNQKLPLDSITELVKEMANSTGIDFYAVETGLTPSGIDLGSSGFNAIEKPEILMFSGEGVSGTGCGELWYMFDQLYRIPVTLCDVSSFAAARSAKYNVIILPEGTYNTMGVAETQKLKSWVQDGGTLIVSESANSWASRNEFGKTKFKKLVENDSTLMPDYANRRKSVDLHTIAGAIFNAEMDLSHPLCYGYTDKNVAVFKVGETVAEPLNTRNAEPVRFTSNPWLSGFVSEKNLNRIKNAPVVSVQKMGQGRIISYHESMSFRGVWLATNKLIANGVFFGSIIR